MIYIGLDLGEVSLGIARSDTGVIANGVETYRFPKGNYRQAANYISKYIKRENIDIIVLGLPKHLSSDIGERAEVSIMFKELLEEKTKKEVILWDERLTTKQALDTMKEAGLSSKKRHENKDMLAAVLILQNYLDYKGEKKDGK
ncbi:MAG TPA: Holliday junction resolvase RuvX [Acholeplasma sp.]|jgi:putative Holliday junction resolvase|nr:Holliday junction resolvase RuvX [Acholeplasma sp.]